MEKKEKIEIAKVIVGCATAAGTGLILHDAIFHVCPRTNLKPIWKVCHILGSAAIAGAVSRPIEIEVDDWFDQFENFMNLKEKENLDEEEVVEA